MAPERVLIERTTPVAVRRKGVRVLVLGPLAVELDGRALHVAGTHRRRLLALLASRPGSTVDIDAIVDAIWRDDPPPTAVKTIQSHVARLRRSLAERGIEAIETAPGGGYRLRADAASVDADEFEQLASEGRQALEARDPSEAVARLTGALGLWRGRPYGEFEDSDRRPSPRRCRLGGAAS